MFWKKKTRKFDCKNLWEKHKKKSWMGNFITKSVQKATKDVAKNLFTNQKILQQKYLRTPQDICWNLVKKSDKDVAKNAS